MLESAQLIHALAGVEGDLKVKFITTEKIFGQYKDIKRRRPDLTKARELLGFELGILAGGRDRDRAVRKKEGPWNRMIYFLVPGLQ